MPFHKVGKSFDVDMIELATTLARGKFCKPFASALPFQDPLHILPIAI